uniref:Acetyl-CoA C-acetyltransferase n=1 Tax=Chenopodium quinoa TaxID=63459 RepID=A0A803MWN0_CHEQI
MDQTSEMQYKSIKPRDVCIVGVARTPMGGLLGSLSTLSATKLGSIAIECALKRARVDPSLVQEVFFGNVLSANLGQAPARQAALGAGIPNSVICTTINKVCSSGMKATMLAAQSIHLGANDVVLAGGMESMSNAPKYLAMARTGSRLGHDTIIDGMLKDGLWDVYNDFGMGICAEICADNYRFSREEQDSFAIRSYERGIAAKNSGAFSWEIAPARFDSVKISGNRGRQTTIIDKDDGLEKFDPAKLKKLPPSFKKNGGSVTAGNSSLISALRLSELATNSDGAAALVLVSGEMAKKHGLQVIARIKGFADAAQVVALANQKLLGLDPEKINVHGGAVSLGHPLGCSGARILVTLLGVLRQKRGKYGVAGICNGGGGASALVLELISTSVSDHSRL